jgi:hypothetical protein
MPLTETTSTTECIFPPERSSLAPLGALPQDPPPHSHSSSPRRAMLHDEQTYPEPERFAPERYLKRTDAGSWALDDSEDAKARDPRGVAFGFGRRCVAASPRRARACADTALCRVCPGRWLAESALWMTVVSVLASVDVVPARDAEGAQVVPPVAVSSGLLSCAAFLVQSFSPLTRWTDTPHLSRTSCGQRRTRRCYERAHRRESHNAGWPDISVMRRRWSAGHTCDISS